MGCFTWSLDLQVPFHMEDRDKWAKSPSKHRSCTLGLTSGTHLGSMERKWRSRWGEIVPSEKSRILVVPRYQIFCCCFSQKPTSFAREFLKHTNRPEIGTGQGFNLVHKLQTYEVGLSSDPHKMHIPSEVTGLHHQILRDGAPSSW